MTRLNVRKSPLLAPFTPLGTDRLSGLNLAKPEISAKLAPVAEITGWHGRMTPRDYAALTPLVWEHVNPYQRFDLNMNARLAYDPHVSCSR